MDAKQKLFEAIQERKLMKTSDVIRFGLENYSNRAERNMRQLAKEGKVIRMTQIDKWKMFGEIKEDVWQIA